MTPNVLTPLILETKYVKSSSEDTDGKVFGKYSVLGFKFEHELKYFNICYLGFIHLVSLYGMITYPWSQKWALSLFCVMYGSISGFGVTAGVHRLFTHRSYRATPLMKIILLICYCAAGQNSVFDWVRDHRIHHKYSETNADPHNSNRGFFFAHIGWLLMKKHPDVINKGKTIDMSDITDDPIIGWFDKHFLYLVLFFSFILPTCIARYFIEETWYWSIITQVFGRYVLILNFIWSVNSAAHLYGNKPYDKTINPRENLLVSFLTVGEGWHNYHHTFPWDYRASEYGKLNGTTFWLDLFAKLGMVYDRKTPSKELIKKVILKSGDGTYNGFKVHVTDDENTGKLQEEMFN